MKCVFSAKPSQKSPTVERYEERLEFKWKIHFTSIPISPLFYCEGKILDLHMCHIYGDERIPHLK